MHYVVIHTRTPQGTRLYLANPRPLGLADALRRHSNQAVAWHGATRQGEYDAPGRARPFHIFEASGREFSVMYLCYYGR